MSIIRALSISKIFFQKGTSITALDDLSLEINEGEIFGILGPNGAGKTTLISILSGLLSADSGKIFINGISISDSPQTIKNAMNVVSGFTGILYNLNVLEALTYYSLLYGKTPKNQDLQNLIDLVGLNGFEKSDAESLSSGNKQKFLIARSLLNNPKILFLDEPTVGLDVESSQNIRQLIQNLKKSGKTLILTTHNMAEAEFLCDRIAIIKSGKLVALDSPQKLREKFEMPLSFELESVDDSLFDQFRQIPNSVFSNSGKHLKIQIPKSALPYFLSLLSKNPSKIISLKSIEDPFDDVFLNILKR